MGIQIARILDAADMTRYKLSLFLIALICTLALPFGTGLQAVYAQTTISQPDTPSSPESQLESAVPLQSSAPTSQEVKASAASPAVSGRATSNQPAAKEEPVASKEKKPASGAKNNYQEQWAKKSVKALQEIGLTLPDSINYHQKIDREGFISILSQATSVPVTVIQQDFYHYAQQIEVDQVQINRAQAVYLLVRAFGLTEALEYFGKQETRFRDINPNHPAFASVVLAENVKLINGYPDQTIRPNETLSWGEALILVETIYSWRQALPTTAPEWVKRYQKQQDIWYQLIDGFRLLLTLIYGLLAIYFLLRVYRKSRRVAQSPYKSISLVLAGTTLLLVGMWVNDLLFNYHLIPREIYALIAMLSVFASLMLLKTGTHIEDKMSEPKPQKVIDKGYVDGINLEKGELYLTDLLSERKSVALIVPDTKIYNQTNGSSESAFFSEIQTGDTVQLRGSGDYNGAVIEADQISITGHEAQKSQEHGTRWQYKQEDAQHIQQRFNRILRSPQDK